VRTLPVAEPTHQEAYLIRRGYALGLLRGLQPRVLWQLYKQESFYHQRHNATRPVSPGPPKRKPEPIVVIHRFEP
jgi:hypothetical protein